MMMIIVQNLKEIGVQMTEGEPTGKKKEMKK